MRCDEFSPKFNNEGGIYAGLLSPREEIAIRLHELRAILDKTQSRGGRGFKLKLHEQNPNASLSPIYFNLKTPDNPKPGPLTLEIVNAIGQQFYYLARDLKLKYNYVAGVPNAGDPFAEAFLRSVIQTPPDQVKLLKLKKEEAREQGGADELKSLDYNLYSIFTISQLLNFYLERKIVNQETFNEIKAYLRSNN